MYTLPQDSTPGDAPDTTTPTAEPSPHDTPFIIELHRREETRSGTFRPDATVLLTPALRTSGLLHALPAEEAKGLLFLFTFVTPNGWCQPSVQELAAAMHTSEAKVQARMQRLRQFIWREQPIVVELTRETGMGAFVPSRKIVSVREAQRPAEPPVPPLQAARRDAVIAHSRAHYAHPRAEVEAMIAEQMGWKEEGDSPEAQACRRLLAIGVLREQIDLILARFDLSRVERQLEWLPYRNAKNPAAFLVAAIEHDYDAPLAVRLQQVAEDTLSVEPESSPQPQAAVSEDVVGSSMSGDPTNEHGYAGSGMPPASAEEPPTPLTLP